MKMTILQKLHKIEKEKIIYTINYRRAGVGIVFYKAEKVKNLPTRKIKIGIKEIDLGYPDNWKQALVINTYYPTFEQAIEAEYKKLKGKIK